MFSVPISVGRRHGWFLAAVLLATGVARPDAFDRLQKDKLKATHEAVVALQAKRKAVDVASGYEDVRAILHCHSHWSHDSRAKIEEILAAAHKTGVRAILFAEHPADHYDFVLDGHMGAKDGVLLVPGAELHGMLAYPNESIKGLSFSGPQEQSDMIRRTGGIAFICHLEERMDWQVAGITGTEIYNTHADVKEEKRLYLGLANPLLWLTLRPLLEEFPQEVFATLQDHPVDYLKRFDELCQIAPHTGVAGNDSHHNIGAKILRGEEDLIRVEDALGEKLAEVRIGQFPFLALLAGKSKPGDTILFIDMDPYERSFRHVSTHLWLKSFDKEGVWDALQAGRAYVAFDWICDPTGFVYQAELGDSSSKKTWPMGSKVPFQPGLKLRSIAPLPGKFRLVRNGVVVDEQEGKNDLVHDVKEPGVYRVEVWQKVGPEERSWILSNPIYVTTEH